MALKLISERRIERWVEYSLCFDTGKERHCGFSFPCNEQGGVDEISLSPEGLKNYYDLLSGKTAYTRKYVEEVKCCNKIPAVMLCHCGRHLDMVPDGAGAVDCECGRIFNLFGQELSPREEWGEETGESLADIYSDRDPEEVR